MAHSRRYLYFVEGETEKKLIDFLKSETGHIQTGKSRVVNLFQTPITSSFLSNIPQKTTIIIVFDTDLANPNKKLFDKNLLKLSKSKNVEEIILIPQVSNLEDEIVHCTDIKRF